MAVATVPYVVGLTGGIGVGKSTAARLLGRRGANILDVDQICKDVIQPGGVAHAAVVARFGRQIVGHDGQLDRAELAKVVFSTPDALTDLTNLSHPAANQVMAAAVAASPNAAVVVLDVAVLAEYPRLGRWPGGGYTSVIVVEAPLETRLRRLIEQRGMTREDAEARIKAQVSDEERRALADHVLDNGGDLASLDAQVAELWPKLSANG